MEEEVWFVRRWGQEDGCERDCSREGENREGKRGGTGSMELVELIEKKRKGEGEEKLLTIKKHL